MLHRLALRFASLPDLKNLRGKIGGNRGAMFGLDARLALAIFAGLSAVTTYSIINVIGDTNKTTLANDLKAVAIAYQNMVLSTGVDSYRFEDLYSNKNNLFNWSGPYIDLDSASHNKYGSFSLMAGSNGESQTNGSPQTCSRKEPCAVWVSLTQVPTDVAFSVDELVDGKPADKMNGRIRIKTGDAGYDTVYYRIQPSQRQ